MFCKSNNLSQDHQTSSMIDCDWEKLWFCCISIIVGPTLLTLWTFADRFPCNVWKKFSKVLFFLTKVDFSICAGWPVGNSLFVDKGELMRQTLPPIAIVYHHQHHHHRNHAHRKCWQRRRLINNTMWIEGSISFFNTKIVMGGWLPSFKNP